MGGLVNNDIRGRGLVALVGGSCVEMHTDKGIFEVELLETGMEGNTEDLPEKEDIENFVGTNVGKRCNS